MRNAFAISSASDQPISVEQRDAKNDLGDKSMATVLVIEDNPLARKMFGVLTESRAPEVVEADDGLAGFALAQERQPDLIVMDWFLPGLCGRPLMRALKDDARTRAIPVIVTTAHASRADEPEVRGSGFDAFLAKPFAVRDFLAMLDAFLAGDGENGPLMPPSSAPPPPGTGPGTVASHAAAW